MPNHEGLLSIVKANYPWLEQLGFLSFVEDGLRDDKPIEQIIAEIRQSDEYARQFPGMLAEDGSRRFTTEREYMERVQDYRDVLMEYGAYDPAQESPQNYTSFFEQGIDPNELRTRFTTYRSLERGTQELRDAFYVYAGLDVSVDDLYRATTSADFRARLVEEYDTAVTRTPPDIHVYIQRATERALDRVSTQVAELERSGAIDPVTAQQIISVDPRLARDVVGALHTGGQVGAQGDREIPVLGLDELITSFEYAMLASAATEQGLALPDREKLEEFRQAGIQRAQALRAYGRYARTSNALEGMSSRANRPEITQSLFEDAAILGKGDAAGQLQSVVSQERALGRGGGGFAAALDGNRIVQRGRGA